MATAAANVKGRGKERGAERGKEERKKKGAPRPSRWSVIVRDSYSFLR